MCLVLRNVTINLSGWNNRHVFSMCFENIFDTREKVRRVIVPIDHCNWSVRQKARRGGRFAVRLPRKTGNAVGD